MRMFIIFFALTIAGRVFPNLIKGINPIEAIFIGICFGLSLIKDLRDAYGKNN